MQREEELFKTREFAETTKQRLVDAIDALPDAFAIYDSEDRLVICNDQYRKTYAVAAPQILPGARYEDLIRACAASGLHPEAAGREEAWIAERVAERRNPGAVSEQALSGERYLQIHERRTSTGDTVGIRVDVTEFKRHQKRLQELADALAASKTKAEHEALHDALTGLPNRRQLDLVLASIEKEARESDTCFLLHVDLDRFKQINDTLGHAAGDRVLRKVADTLRSTVRKSDLVARIGGDEFVVLCRDRASPDEIQAVADRIVAALATPITLDGHVCRIGASVGLASSKADAAGGLLINADIALYKAKHNGRNCVVAFTAQLQEELNEKKRTADDILRGLESGEFLPVFQPQFDARTLECVGLEALARWEHPVRGRLGPNAFLPVAEELNVVDRIDRAILRSAAETCALLQDQGLRVPKLSVNVSLRRLLDDSAIEDVEEFCRSETRIAFELLETIYFDDERSEVSDAIERLRAVGVEIEIDDFGSGRASVIGLLKISPHRLKIDRNLVMPITECARHRRLVEAIVDMGRSQGIGVIAEGVETAAHAAALTEIGCDALQGFFFARPAPAAELPQILLHRHAPLAS